MNANDVMDLLAARHADDVFVPECTIRSGPSGGRRLDAWVLKTTWSPVTTIGYEVKVSRSDFLSDDKWPAYLAVCHQFYFVAPAGVIEKSEVPENCGLIRVSASGRKLYTLAKAPRREVKLPGALMAGVLMNRAEICEPRMMRNARAVLTREERIAKWRSWLEMKREAKLVGAAVASEMMSITRVVDHKNRSLEKKLRRWGRFAAALKARGVDPHGAWLNPAIDASKVDDRERAAASARRAKAAIETLRSFVEEVTR